MMSLSNRLVRIAVTFNAMKKRVAFSLRLVDDDVVIEQALGAVTLCMREERTV